MYIYIYTYGHNIFIILYICILCSADVCMYILYTYVCKTRPHSLSLRSFELPHGFCLRRTIFPVDMEKMFPDEERTARRCFLHCVMPCLMAKNWYFGHWELNKYKLKMVGSDSNNAWVMFRWHISQHLSVL